MLRVGKGVKDGVAMEEESDGGLMCRALELFGPQSTRGEELSRVGRGEVLCVILGRCRMRLKMLLHQRREESMRTQRRRKECD